MPYRSVRSQAMGEMMRSRRDASKILVGSALLPAFYGSRSGRAAEGPAAKFIFANNAAYDSIDPHAIFDALRVATRFNLYDGLYRYVDNPPKLIPWLAES